MTGLDISLLMPHLVRCAECDKSVDGFWAEHNVALQSTEIRANCHGKIIKRVVGDSEAIALPLFIEDTGE